MFIVFIVITISVGYIAYWYIERKRKYGSLDQFPGPSGYPIIGNALEFGFTPVDLYQSFLRLPKVYGGICKLWIGPSKCYLMVTDPELVEFIVTSAKHTFKSSDYEVGKPWLSNGLLLSNGNYWQRRRKIITPTFYFKILEQFIDTFLSQADTLVDILSTKVDKGVFDIYPFISDYTIDTICETAMGTSVNAQKYRNHEYSAAVRGLTNILLMRMFSFWKKSDLFYMFTNDYKMQNKYLKIIHGFTRQIIQQRKNKFFSNIQNDADVNNEYNIKKKVVFLDMLLKATIDGEPLRDEDIREEVDTFMFAGQDTVASALSFLFYELANNTRVQNKIMDELRELFGNDKNRQLSLADLNNMKYTEIVIKETLRMYPSALFFGRELQEDTHYKGTCLPKGLQIFIILTAMHRRPDLFKDPNTFYPERFLEDKDSKKNLFAYIPFSAGPRNCIGQKFAVNEMKAVIYKVLSNYELSTAGDEYNIILSAETTLKSANGMNIQVKNRT